VTGRNEPLFSDPGFIGFFSKVSLRVNGLGETMLSSEMLVKKVFESNLLMCWNQFFMAGFHI